MIAAPAFTGSIPEHYQRHLVPLIFEDYADELAAQVDIPADGAVLETACGTGVVTRRLRQRFPNGARIVATDVNAQMLEVARREATGDIEWGVADATDLPFGAGSFDAVVCQFGAMFFADRARGYQEAVRVLKPGGRFCFNVWDALQYNDLPHRVHRIVADLLPDDPPDFLALPFGYCDTFQIEAELREAGFEDVRIWARRAQSCAPSAADVAMAFVAGTPLAAQLAERGDVDEFVGRVGAALQAAYGDGPIAAPMQAITIVASVVD